VADSRAPGPAGLRAFRVAGLRVKSVVGLIGLRSRRPYRVLGVPVWNTPSRATLPLLQDGSPLILPSQNDVMPSCRHCGVTLKDGACGGVD